MKMFDQECDDCLFQMIGGLLQLGNWRGGRRGVEVSFYVVIFLVWRPCER